MRRYKNGEIPASHLVEVEPGLFLESATASAYRRMKAAAARDGVQLAIPRPAGAYRSLFVQQDMHDRPWLYNLDPTSTVQLAKAGYSTHGDGTRVDIVRGVAGDWAIRNAERFGFVREFGAADPRHFRYTGTTQASTGAATIEPDPRKAEPMYLLKTTDGTISLVTGTGIAHFTDMAHADLFVRLLKTEPGKWDTFNTAQRAIIESYIAKTRAPAGGGASAEATAVAVIKALKAAL